MNQFNLVSAEYELITENDPVKNYVQYPEALRLLGDIEKKEILDIGCGNGIFDRIMVKQGASTSSISVRIRVFLILSDGVPHKIWDFICQLLKN